jgi:hypothetical protein
MTAGNYDFYIEKDRTFLKTLQVFDQTTGTAFDLTDYSIKMEIRTSPGSAVLFTFSTAVGNITIVDATQGIFSLNLTPAESSALSFTKASYDLIFISLTNVTEILEGYVNVLSNITSST